MASIDWPHQEINKEALDYELGPKSHLNLHSGSLMSVAFITHHTVLSALFSWCCLEPIILDQQEIGRRRQRHE